MTITIVEISIGIGITIALIFVVNFLRACCCKPRDPLAESIPIINNNRINTDAEYTDI